VNALKTLRIAILAMLATALAPSAASAGFTSIVAFGDSLSDTGNVFLATGGTTPATPPYYMGHYSNGPVWLEQFAGLAGLPVPTPSLLGGTDNAFGGAETGLTGSSFLGTPNIGTQITGYLAGHTLGASQLVTLWGGANDFLNAGQVDPTVPVNNLATEITTLAGAGANRSSC
jgi:phospholipase/lecithinase/hemolysin